MTETETSPTFSELPSRLEYLKPWLAACGASTEEEARKRLDDYANSLDDRYAVSRVFDRLADSGDLEVAMTLLDSLREPGAADHLRNFIAAIAPVPG